MIAGEIVAFAQIHTIQNSAIESRWEEAFRLWLESRRAENTRQAYTRAINDLLIYCNKPVWCIGRTDVSRWVGSMRENGLSDATIQLKLAAVSSLFRFASRDYTQLNEDGTETSLCLINPADGAAIRPRVDMFSRSRYLTASELKALFTAIGKRDNVRALQDFALFYGYVMTARRNSEWRTIRWGDFERNGKKVFYRWSGKRVTDAKHELPPPVWKAVMDYLAAAGRTHLKPEDAIFIPLTDMASRLPAACNWDPKQPISIKEVNRRLKGYARRAGLDATQIHVHMLRHSGAMLRKQAGADLEEIRDTLAHRNVNTTQIYLHTLEGQTDRHWATVTQLLGL